MPGTGDKRRPAGPGGVGAPRYALPTDLAGSLRHLDDGQLEQLLRAVTKEARRRGRPPGDEAPPAPRSGSNETQGRTAPAGKVMRGRRSPLPPGQEKVIRAAFEAGVKPGTIARQFRVSRAQVEQIVGKPTRGARK